MKAAHTGFSRAEGGSLAANERLPMHILSNSLPCLLGSLLLYHPLLSFFLSSPLPFLCSALLSLLSSTLCPLLLSSVCLSLQAETLFLLCVGGWAHRLQLPLPPSLALSLTPLTLNYAVQKKKNRPYLADRGCMNSFKVSQQLEKMGHLPPHLHSQSNEADIFGINRTHRVCAQH